MKDKELLAIEKSNRVLLDLASAESWRDATLDKIRRQKVEVEFHIAKLNQFYQDLGEQIAEVERRKRHRMKAFNELGQISP